MHHLPDPTTHADWQIAAAAEQQMKKIYQLRDELGLLQDEVMPSGHYVGKLDFRLIEERFRDKPNGKFINVTATTPTPLGSGKSTTTIGLIQGLSRIGKQSIGAIRQPSLGPVFNIKGSAAGGGRSQCIPLTPFSLGLTGDLDAITKAHNLAMVALTARLQHEFNYGDKMLSSRKLQRLDIDPRHLTMGWAIDLCAQSLRDITIGQGSSNDGFLMRSGFQITASSEVMAVLSVATGMEDLRQRLSRIIVAYDKRSNPITTADLEVDGAMAALLYQALYPNMVQTVEGQPVLVHTGPFANIALGQSSIIADKVALKLADYHVTESGFGADIGYEKFWNVKSRLSGLAPDCSVIVTTLRELKMHGGAPDVKAGRPLDAAYADNRPDLVEKGLCNLEAHIETVKRSGTTPVVCLNHFYTDHDDEVLEVIRRVNSLGVRMAVSKHWELGGEGAEGLAEAVVDACEEPTSFQFLYRDDEQVKDKINRIATTIYGADKVNYSPAATAAIARIEGAADTAQLPVCMAKTQFSLSDRPELKGRPTGWSLFIRDVLLYQGAGLIVPVAGDIKLMPGTGSDPAFRRVDVDTETGQVTGLF